jgi:hypothetical protein
MWLLSSSQQWPNGGEIDILEGVDDYTANCHVAYFQGVHGLQQHVGRRHW